MLICTKNYACDIPFSEIKDLFECIGMGMGDAGGKIAHTQNPAFLFIILCIYINLSSGMTVLYLKTQANDSYRFTLPDICGRKATKEYYNILTNF